MKKTIGSKVGGDIMPESLEGVVGEEGVDKFKELYEKL